MLHEGSDGRGEQRIFFEATPGEKREASAGLEDAARFSESGLDLGDKHDAEAAGDAVEFGVGKRKALGVSDPHFEMGESLGARVFFRGVEHLGRQVTGDDTSAGADGFGDAERGLSGAAGQVEHVVPGGELRALDYEVGGGLRLKFQLVVPLFPVRSGGGPFFAQGLADVIIHAGQYIELFQAFGKTCSAKDAKRRKEDRKKSPPCRRQKRSDKDGAPGVAD